MKNDTITTEERQRKIIHDQRHVISLFEERCGVYETVVAKCSEYIALLEAAHAGCGEKIATLESRLAALEKNSSNSSKPPSSDIAPPKNNQSLRQKSNRRSGGQPGHQGATRMRVATPDVIVSCRPEACTGCGASLAGLPGSVRAFRQVADLPPVQLRVTEYQQEAVRCTNCGKNGLGSFPSHIPASFQFGTHLRSLVVYLNVAHHLPFARCAKLMEDLLHARVGQGTVDDILSRASAQGEELHQQILALVKKGGWVGSDETGVRVEKKTWWQWVWQNVAGSFYVIDPGRGYEVVKRFFGEQYPGTLVHDCWSAQNNTVAGFHQLCHAHLLRDLQFCLETNKHSWAYRLQQLLLASQRARPKIWAEGFDATIRTRIIDGFQAKLSALLTASPPSGKETRRIWKRVRKHRQSIFHFLSSPDIPFHNNSSEQAIRNAKIKKKVSGCFRSEHGAQRHAILLSIVETCKKRNMDVFASLRLLLEGRLTFQEG